MREQRRKQVQLQPQKWVRQLWLFRKQVQQLWLPRMAEVNLKGFRNRMRVR